MTFHSKSNTLGFDSNSIVQSSTDIVEWPLSSSSPLFWFLIINQRHHQWTYENFLLSKARFESFYRMKWSFIILNDFECQNKLTIMIRWIQTLSVRGKREKKTNMKQIVYRYNLICRANNVLFDGDGHHRIQWPDRSVHRPLWLKFE